MEEVVFEKCVRALCKHFATKDNDSCDRCEPGLNVDKAKLHSFFFIENNTGGDTLLQSGVKTQSAELRPFRAVLLGIQARLSETRTAWRI
jgi:hypothetical protein